MKSGTYKEFLLLNIFVLFFIATIENSIAEDMDKLILDLKSRDWTTRLSAVEKLGRIRDEKTINLLMGIAGTISEKWEVKVRAIRLLGEIGDPKTAKLLIGIFNNPLLNKGCPAIKWHTAIALGNFKNDPGVADALINALDYDNLVVREAAIQSLGEIGDSRAAPLLIPELKDKSFAIKFSAIKALKKIGDPQAIPALKQIAENDEDLYIKNEALSALKNFAVKGN